MTAVTDCGIFILRSHGHNAYAWNLP